MNSILKKALGVIVFLALIFTPAILILLFVFDDIKSYSMLVFYFVIVVFSIWGYLVVSMRNLSKEFKDAVESMKKQNAAIAYKLTKEIDASDMKKSDKDKKSEDEEKIDVMKVNLNPADPLIPPKTKGKKNNKNKKIDDNYDDFR